LAVSSIFLTLLLDLRFLRPLAHGVSESVELISAALRRGLPLVLRAVAVDLAFAEEEGARAWMMSSSDDALLVDSLAADGLSLGDVRL